MFCESCGKQIPDEAKFCPICGTRFNVSAPATEPVPVPAEEPVTAPVEASAPVEPAPAYEPAQQTAPMYAPAPQPAYAAPAAPAKPPRQKPDIGQLMRTHGKLLGIIGAAAIALILLIIIICAVASSGGAYVPTGTPHTYYVNDDNTVYMFCGEKLIEEFEVDSDASGTDIVVSHSVSSDRTVSAIVTDDGALRLFNGKKTTLIADELVERAVTSSDGNAVVYLVNDDGDRTLNIFKGGKSKLIAELEYPDESEIFTYYYLSYAVSPDGSAVVFTQYDKDGEYEVYGWNGGEPMPIDDNLSPLSVSDGGKLSYLVNYNDNELYAYDSFKKELIKIKDYDSYVAMTTDRESIMYVNEKGDTMVYNPSMEEPIEVAGKELTLLSPPYTESRSDSFDEVIAKTEDGDVYRYTLKGDRYEKTKLASDVWDSCRLSADGKQLLYLDDDELCVINTTTKKPKEKVLYEDVRSFPYTTGDFKHIYFVEDDGDMMYGNVNGDDAEEIAEYISSAAITADGTLVGLVFGELFYSKRGGELTRCEYPDEGEVIRKNGNSAIIVEYDDELYTSTNGIKYTKTDADLG